MQITNVNVNKIEKENSRLKGLATVILDDQIAIHNIRIIEGERGLFLAMPSRKIDEDKYTDIVHPITKDSRKMLENTILEKYKSCKNERSED